MSDDILNLLLTERISTSNHPHISHLPIIG